MILLRILLAMSVFWGTLGGSPQRQFCQEGNIWPPFHEDWQYQVDSGNRFSSPAVGDGIIVFKYMQYTEPVSFHLVCLNASNGKFIWSYVDKLEENGKGFAINPARDHEGSPTIFEDRVYVTSQTHLYSINLSDGSMFWKKKYPDIIAYDLFYISPLVFSTGATTNVVLKVPYFKTVCHEASEGQLLWEIKKIEMAISPTLFNNQTIMTPSHLTFKGSQKSKGLPETPELFGQLVVGDGWIVGYFSDLTFKKFRYEEIFNRFTLEWSIEDSSFDTINSFMINKIPTVTPLGIILPLNSGLALFNFSGKKIWQSQSKSTTLATVVGFVALQTSPTCDEIVPINIRDGLSYGSIHLPSSLVSHAVPYENGFFVVTMDGLVRCFKGANPPKISTKKIIRFKTYKGWDDVYLPVMITNVGGSRMYLELVSNTNFLVPAEGTFLCESGQSIMIKISIISQEQGEKTGHLTINSDGGHADVLAVIDFFDGLPDKKDLNLDNKVDANDLAIIIQNLGNPAIGQVWEREKRSDLNLDGKIDFFDLELFFVQ